MTVAVRGNAPGPTVDLHLHTRASDGGWTPEALVERVGAAGIGIMAVADHDTIGAVAEVTALATPRGIVVVPAVELTTRWDGRQWHTLIYGAEFVGTSLGHLVDDLHLRQVRAAREAIAALREARLEVPSLREVIDDREPLPIYVMTALIRDGYARSHVAANRFVEQRLGLHFYFDVPLASAVDAAHAAGGVVVLAHPGRSEREPLSEERLGRLLQYAPVDGLEAYYPTHTPEQTVRYRALARSFGLLCSCGSDSHGPGQPRDPIPYPAGDIAALLTRLMRTKGIG